ncbi:hypothetical protein Ae201684P_012435 [Aphanomyces euteiches]|uniref:DDE Tnp4 domain-containing protein n=1 Tax=Aphanomyces euteiches TaxID=100861 RepID=A0A6G0WD02_9STRA|nr:hypothetical protein Ae201684_016823 [Aphanomyces euteiches]KAH9075945.1 hypothetical protein Ae201684P_012435 [Aphanomyces euteiches]
MNIQALVNHKMVFMSVDIRVGSYSHKKIWKVSLLGQTIRRLIPTGCFILGDSGYTLPPWLMTPYMAHEEGGRLLAYQKQFNYRLSSTRMAVECAFGRLKERFRIMKTVMNEKRLDQTVAIVTSCFVLHNMFIHFNDGLFSEPCRLRDRNTYFQAPDESETETNPLLRRIARAKRDGIANVRVH